ncbi:four helix bundle protein [Caloranaerobacter azorensis DSM 13643]|uniref:Four helix bundle protein n=1 Tax=Caloranaerobacter azorensis DSM 13643 TaxID=1121264 RepID=A0A1M5V3N6_9FIRM|nr:four helix bundle protein [Caloranaerobacter azorensis]SHH69887.1 four helix bundle protein [Caloranaerobacter azorensis DSM 13643]
MKKENIVREKSFDFALKVIRLYKYIVKEKKEFIISKQLLRSGTSIGANVEEACAGQSKKDFIAKLSIALKEAFETRYWLKLLRDSEGLNTEYISNMIAECNELISIITRIIKTAKENLD